MKKLAVTFMAFAFLNMVKAQITDSIVHSHLKLDLYDKSWCISVNAGVQKRLFFAAGIARTSFKGSQHGAYGSDIYAGINIFPAFKKTDAPVAGLKFGGDLFGNTVLIGAEIQYLKSRLAEDWMFTPRAGIGISYIYLAYGYGFSKNKFPVAGISRNSITLQVNFPFYTKDKLTNKVTYWGGMKKQK
jgi:hypothetical protein